MKGVLISLTGLWAAAAVSGAVEEVRDGAGFAEKVQPFLKEHCLRCHGPEKQKGDVRLDTGLAENFLEVTAKQKWGDVVEVLNSHEMPPEKEKQPEAAQVAAVVDWVTAQLVKAELVRRDGAVVLRRLNREEYGNTIRELTGVEWDVSGFPADPAAGGFDNNGRALTVSPMHMELYIEAARRILDRALPEGAAPEVVRWRFEPEEGSGDDHRVRLPDKQNPIVHGGKNEKRGGMTVMHHNSWDRNANARDFSLPAEGEYIVRVRAAGRVPGRAEVVAAAEKQLAKRRDEELAKKPGNKWAVEAYEKDLAHFKTDRIYNYGPPRLKLVQDLGGQPRVLAEFDVDAPAKEPRTHEFRAWFTKQKAGLTLEYAYSIPRVLENFWMQGRDEFARPEALLDWFEIEGPFPLPQPVVPVLAPDGEEAGRARATLAGFMRRAWRRPVTEEEVSAKVALFDRVRKEKPSFTAAIKVPLVAVLASPHFLYLTEPAVEKGPRPLTSHELACRLSYFLWCGPPDAALSALADAEKLDTTTTLAAQVDRMLKDGRSGAFVKNFAGQWLGLREVGANPPSMDLYPEYDRHLETSFVEESRAFFAEVLRSDLGVVNFLRSDFVTVNERLARFYGIDGVKGDDFRVVKVPPGVHRGGVASQGSVLTITSNGTRTSPVKRGVWVMKTLLGTDPGLPVANAGDLAPKVPGLDKATVRQRLQIHREQPQCARCHDKIDPLGFALENFNAAGQWREQEGHGYQGRIEKNDPVIDASSKLPDGTECRGFDRLGEALVKRQDLFFHALASRLFTYALGREPGLADEPAIKSAVAEMKDHGGTLRSLIQAVVRSDTFRTK